MLKGVSDPETMEEIACREGLALANDLGLQKLQLASDCANVVRSIRDNGLGQYGHIVQEIRASLNDFQVAEVRHEGRVSNEDAHRLATSSIYKSCGRHVWLVNPLNVFVFLTVQLLNKVWNPSKKTTLEHANTSVLNTL